MNLWLPPAVIALSLPPTAVWLLLWNPVGRVRLDWREALAWTAVAWTVYSVAVIELLSLGTGHNLPVVTAGNLSRSTVFAAWAVPLLLAIGVLMRSRPALSQLLIRYRSIGVRLRGLNQLERLLVLGTVFCLVVVGLIAWIAAPNNWDSMTYHLARVWVWLRLGGVAHYATNVEPQLFQPPGAEYLITQWQVLVGSDRLAASVQWFAYCGVVIVAALAAARLGCGRRGQLIAAFLVAASPMAMMQGSSTQNDLLLTFWLLIAATLTLALWDAARSDARTGERTAARDSGRFGIGIDVARGLLAAAALGLALLTKGTAFLFVPPIAIALIAVGFRRLGRRRALATAICGLLIATALNAGAWLRNNQTYGTPLATGSGAFDYSNNRVTLATVGSNLMRNAAIYMGTPWESVNSQSTDLVRGALEAVGINPDDPATTFRDHPFAVPKSGPHEDHAAGTIIFVLAIWALVLALFVKRIRSSERAAWAVAVIVGALLFCAAVKWQPWHSRLHLPLLTASIPLIAVALERLRKQSITAVIIVLAALSAPVYLFHNVTRPLIGDRSILTTERVSQYFTPRPSLAATYRAAVQTAAAGGASKLGMSGGIDEWEYPMMVLAERAGIDAFGVLVDNRSNKYADRRRLPDAVACFNCDDLRRRVLATDGLSPQPLDVRQPPGIDTSNGVLVELWMRDSTVPGR